MGILKITHGETHPRIEETANLLLACYIQHLPKSQDT